MTSVREYRVPLLIAAGALVAAIILWAVLISPQNSKLSSLKAQQAQLQNQQTELQTKLASLQTEQQKLSANCSDLEKIDTQIPSVQSPTDVDAEESSFESQFNALTASSGVSLTQFSGFTPATTTGSTAASGSTTGTPVGVTAVPTTLAVTGDYQHIMKFISGLDSFPRLFVIQTFDLTVGTTSATTATAGAAPVAAAAPAAGAPALWAGQAETVPTASPYNLSITGSIYYTSTPSALAACTTATAPS
jgi:Tfp pilus assembly protein PilO